MYLKKPFLLSLTSLCHVKSLDMSNRNQSLQATSEEGEIFPGTKIIFKMSEKTSMRQYQCFTLFREVAIVTKSYIPAGLMPTKQRLYFGSKLK